MLRLSIPGRQGFIGVRLRLQLCQFVPVSYTHLIGKLLTEKTVEIVGADGSRRRSSAQIKDTDQIMSPPQRTLFAI